ncbi:MAG TPA: hypothetical protein VEX68_27275 [Bryobacteraceae bacterium]|nr:hypothetical protein [Bryobacteraceae bacterium]
MNRIAVNTFWRRCTLALLSTLSVCAFAQTTHQFDVNRATVVYASGNDLTVKMEDGTLKHFVVPSDYKLSVDGNQVSVQDLKPGTKLTQTITTTTEERLVSEIRTVDVKVVEAKPPNLTISSGDKTKHFRVPEGTKFNVNGKDMTLADLREGMRIKGTVVTTVPSTVVSRSRNVTGKTDSPKTVATPALVGVLLIELSDVP